MLQTHGSGKVRTISPKSLTNWLRTLANMIKEGSIRNRETTMINNPAEDFLAFVQYDDRICQTWCASSPGKLSARER
jgi:hypothetical protein